MDWHGPSADDAWGTVSALNTILETSSQWKAWVFAPERVIIIGHSNGGQGTWYNAARYPDRVAASKEELPYSLAWSKSAYFSDPCRWIHQSTGLRPFNPLTVSVPTPQMSSPQCAPTNHCHSSAHFIDPFLRAILESSFTPDDNDLFLSNLVDTPSLVLHGWVCRVFLLKSSSHLIQLCRRECTHLALEGASKCLEDMGNRRDCKVNPISLALASSFHNVFGCSYHEEPGQGHWYPSVFRNERVKAFLDSVLDDERPPPRCSTTFTLTSAVPAETGSLHGWRILSLVSPGRWVSITGILWFHHMTNYRCRRQIGASNGRKG